MNVLGNRHVGNNVRLLLINNGKGNEFRNYGHPCSFLGKEADKYVAAAGHYGNKSSQLVKNYAIDLGYEYFAANNKEEFNSVIDKFLIQENTEKPMVLEVFTETDDESYALKQILNTISTPKQIIKNTIKSITKELLGQSGIEAVKKMKS